MKKYLICSLNDENYTMAQFRFCDTAEEVRLECLRNIMEYYELDEERVIEHMNFSVSGSQHHTMFRYDYANGDAFFVNQIIEIDIEEGDSVLVWHHAYDGVDFKVEHIGTEAMCINVKAAISNNAYIERGFDIDIEKYQTVVDTDEEWEVWDVIKYDPAVPDNKMNIKSLRKIYRRDKI